MKKITRELKVQIKQFAGSTKEEIQDFFNMLLSSMIHYNFDLGEGNLNAKIKGIGKRVNSKIMKKFLIDTGCINKDGRLLKGGLGIFLTFEEILGVQYHKLSTSNSRRPNFNGVPRYKKNLYREPVLKFV